MSNKMGNTSILQWFVGALIFWVASFQLFQAGTALGQSVMPVTGVGSIGQSQLAIAGAVLCGFGSICLGVGSVLLDRRIRTRKKLRVEAASVQA